MKKLVVLILFMFMASVATAALTITVSLDGSTVEINSTTAVPIAGMLQWSSTELDSATAGLTALSAAGSLSTWAVYGIFAEGFNGAPITGTIAAFNSADITVGGYAGIIVELTHTGLTFGLIDYDLGEVVLLSNSMEELGSVYVVPEPMTMVLLGVGGLFLRRRKK